MQIKKKPELQLIKEGGKLMGQILADLKRMTKPGMSTFDVDKLAEKMILEVGGKPAFKGYKAHFADTPFPSTICASVNTELVHAIARKNVILKDGDIFSIDIGMEYPSKNIQGFFTDTAITFPIGTISSEKQKLLEVTKKALEEGIKAAAPGKSIAAIGKAIETYVKKQGKYGIVRDLVGHGVGYKVHEEPVIPNYYDPSLESIKLIPGMVIAIEPMLSITGEYRVRTKKDGWTIEMLDGSLCAHFEHTLIITKTGNIVVTRRPGEK